MNLEVLGSDLPLAEDTPGQGCLVDFRGRERLAGQRAVDSRQSSQGHENLVNLLLLSEQVVDIRDLAVNPRIEDSVAATNDRLVVRTPGKSYPWCKVVVVARKPRLQLEFMTSAEGKREVLPQAPRVLSKEAVAIRPASPVGVAESLLIDDRQA